MPKRRVLQLVLSLSPGGTERLVIDICKRLADRIESVICCLDERGEWADELERQRIPVVAIGRRPGFHISIAWRIAELIRTHAIEVVHCHHYSPYVYGRLATTIAPATLIFTEHGRLSDAPPSAKRRLVNPVLARTGGRIYAVSENLKAHMIEEGFPSGRVGVIYNGIDPGEPVTPAARIDARARLGIPADAIVIGSVGRLDPVKNFGQLLRAHAVVTQRHPAARLVLVGDGPERGALAGLAHMLAISHAVQFAGYRADVRSILPAFDAYVNCSIYEGVSLTILEAMAASLPVVASAVGGNPEVVVDGETGLVTSTRDRDLAFALGRLMDSSALRQAMGRAGRRRVQAHFQLARMVEAYAADYRVPAATAAIKDAPMTAPTPADPMSVSDATRSTV